MPLANTEQREIQAPGSAVPFSWDCQSFPIQQVHEAYASVDGRHMELDLTIWTHRLASETRLFPPDPPSTQETWPSRDIAAPCKIF
jgi:hypothetical protein